MPKLKPIQVQALAPMEDDLLRSLRALRQPAATTDERNRIVGLHVAFHGPVGGPCLPVFPIGGLAVVHEGSQVCTEARHPGLLERTVLSRAGSEALHDCLKALSRGASPLRDLAEQGEDLAVHLAPAVKKHGIGLAAFSAFCAVIVPNAYVVYPEYAGSIHRSVKGRKGKAKMPKGIFRVALANGLSSHQSLVAWGDLCEAVRHVCDQPFFDPDIKVGTIRAL